MFFSTKREYRTNIGAGELAVNRLSESNDESICLGLKTHSPTSTEHPSVNILYVIQIVVYIHKILGTLASNGHLQLIDYMF